MVTFSSIRQFMSDRDYLIYTNTFIYRENKESYIEGKKRVLRETNVKNKSLLEKVNNTEKLINKFKGGGINGE